MIIVTGAAGFIGSNLVKRLNNEGYDDIIAVDSLEKGEKHRNLNRLEIKDFIDKKELWRYLHQLGGAELVFHLGACSNTMENNGRYMMQENYEFSKTLLGFCLRDNKRFIYASSASVYGGGENGFIEKGECEYPLNVYAYSKFFFDRYVSRLLSQASSQIVGLRYFNVYGPQENHKGNMASVIYHFHNQIMEDGKIKLFEGSADFRRDFVFVNDVIDVNMYFMKNSRISGIFNCGTGNARSFLDIANIMKELYEGAEISYIPFPEKLKGKYQSYTQADLSKLSNAGYTRKFSSLEEGVAKYVDVLKESGGYL